MGTRKEHPSVEQRRATDGWKGRIAAPFTFWWNWIDERDIDKHVISLAILFGTWRLTLWAMDFASLVFTTSKSGVEVGAVIAAVTAPYMALQAAAIKFYFDTRRD